MFLPFCQVVKPFEAETLISATTTWKHRVATQYPGSDMELGLQTELQPAARERSGRRKGKVFSDSSPLGNHSIQATHDLWLKEELSDFVAKKQTNNILSALLWGGNSSLESLVDGEAATLFLSPVCGISLWLKVVGFGVGCYLGLSSQLLLSFIVIKRS